MKYRGIVIVVEGQTEEEFVNVSLRPWFNSLGIYDVRAICIITSKTAKGGNSNYEKLKNDVTRYLKQEQDILVTSFVDFFRLPTNFPNYAEAKKITDVLKKVSFLEESLAKDINSARFIPYIQLHEFEALLFTDVRGFQNIPKVNESHLKQVLKIIENYPNPELINDSPQTAPSKRLEQIIPRYGKLKVLYGNNIIKDNSFSAILQKCPRFKNWIQTLARTIKPEINFD